MRIRTPALPAVFSAIIIFVAFAAHLDISLFKSLSRLGRTACTYNFFGSNKDNLSSGTLSNSAANKSIFKNMAKTPVYFLSHGGPNVMYDTQHPAYAKLGAIGEEITKRVRPNAVVVFSAHWQGERDAVLVNTAEETELIYDFSGFPAHYYQEKFPNVGSKSLADQVLGLLHQAGIKARGVTRGLDHGVWASFKCAFNPETNPLNVPIVQVSLYASEDPARHFALGRAVSALRDQGVAIIVSGMAVHNLRDLMFTWGDPTPLQYTVTFDEALREAVEGGVDSETAAKNVMKSIESEASLTEEMVSAREKRMTQLLGRRDARKAHPTFDHLLPIYVGAGAAGSDQGERLWTLAEGSMSWGMYRFGQVSA